MRYSVRQNPPLSNIEIARRAFEQNKASINVVNPRSSQAIEIAKNTTSKGGEKEVAGDTKATSTNTKYWILGGIAVLGGAWFVLKD